MWVVIKLQSALTEKLAVVFTRTLLRPILTSDLMAEQRSQSGNILLHYIATLHCYTTLLQYIYAAVTLRRYATLLRYVVALRCYATFLRYFVMLLCCSTLLCYVVALHCYAT